MSRIGGSTDIFSGNANVATISYLASLDATASASSIDLSSAEGDIDNLTILTAALDGRLDTEEAATISFDGRLDIVEPAITALDGRLDIAEPAITALDGRLDIVEPAITALDGRLDIVEPAIIALDGRLDIVEPEITALDGRLDTAEADIVVLQGSLGGAAIEDLQDRMLVEEGISTAHEAEITALQADVIDADNNINKLILITKLIEYPIVNNITGTVPLRVGSFILPIGTYLNTKANFGCSLPADTATLSVNNGATVIITKDRTGVPVWSTMSNFTLTSETEVDVWLVAGATTATAISYCIKFKVS